MVDAERHYILDEHNNPVLCDNYEAWLIWYNATNRLVGYSQITSEVEVSTVFLGLDHNWSDRGPPVLFETMIFGGSMNLDCRRYCTYDEARRGHDEIVQLARAAQRRVL